MVSVHSEKAQMCSKLSLRSFPNIAFETVLSYKTTLKQQLNSEKWNVGSASAFCWTVLLCCFSIQCFCRCVFSLHVFLVLVYLTSDVPFFPPDMQGSWQQMCHHHRWLLHPDCCLFPLWSRVVGMAPEQTATVGQSPWVCMEVYVNNSFS